jgi:hypothetical protein
MVDLELIHNFTSFTHATLSSQHAMRQMFKTTVIRLALDCEFLMRSLLAVSAVHLAHFRRDREQFYVGIGMEHHQVACRSAVSSMNNLESLTQQDCENLHLFSVLTLFFGMCFSILRRILSLTVSALGSPKGGSDSLIMGESLTPSWLTMLRSSEPILQVLNPQNYKGPLGPIFAFGRSRWNIIFGNSHPVDGSLLMDLQSAVNKSCTELAPLAIYNDTIERLRRVLSMVFEIPAGGNDGDGHSALGTNPKYLPKLEAWDIFVWQWDVAKEFIALLRETPPQQEAVTIYAHFLIMLKKLESHWWLEGWAKHMMERVWDCLDEEHRLWIQWPIEELGWVPPL